MKREANPGKPTISSPLNERERQGMSFAFDGRTEPKKPFQASDFAFVQRTGLVNFRPKAGRFSPSSPIAISPYLIPNRIALISDDTEGCRFASKPHVAHYRLRLSLGLIQ